MLTEPEIISRMRDGFRRAGEKCDAISRLGPLGGSWLEISRELDAIEGCLRQISHWRGDARWLQLVPVYAKAKEAGRMLYLLNRWPDFRKFGLIFAQGLARMDDLATKPTGKSGPILPKFPDPPKETMH